MDLIAVALMLVGTLGHFTLERYADAVADQAKQRRCQRAKKLCVVAALLGLGVGIYHEVKEMDPREQRVFVK